MDRRTFLQTASLTAIAAALPSVAENPHHPFPAHHIYGNLYYVGNDYDASFLVVTPAGNILINSSYVTSYPMLRGSIEKLGFRWADTRYLLISHGHNDHCAGAARIVRETNATYCVMDADVSVVETGGATDFRYANDRSMQFPRSKVTRVLHDGDKVSLGGSTLTAVKTPGHTMGCTTWTMSVTENGKPLHAVIVGSPNFNPGYKFVNNAQYPQIVSDYRHTFATLHALPCDIFLGAHGGYYGLEQKYPRLGHGANPFIDPAGYKAYVNEREAAFREEMQRQGAA